MMISIHAPRVGSDCFGGCVCETFPGFQSTLPVWGATVMRNCLSLPDVISIHAPRVGSDQAMATKAGMNGLFQSTLPVWGATGILIISHGGRRNFNPRSPCGERPATTTMSTAERYFNPRSPCGERQVLGSVNVREAGFQSTLPVWGATTQWDGKRNCTRIFQSTLPVWGATPAQCKSNNAGNISIHAPRVGSDSVELN